MKMPEIGGDGEHDQRELPIGQQEHHHTADDHQQHPQQQCHTGAGEHAHDIDIAGDAGHQLARLYLVEVGEG